MNTHLVGRLITAYVILAVLFLSGCANYLAPELGAVAKEDSRIALTGDKVKDAVWKTNDLKLTYSLAEEEGEFILAGKLVFDRSLTNSYPSIRKFILKMSFLGDNGQVLETVDITPIFTMHSEAPEEMSFKKYLAKPAGSKAIAFNYYGVFRGDLPDVGETWDIFYFPFD